MAVKRMNAPGHLLTGSTNTMVDSPLPIPSDPDDAARPRRGEPRAASDAAPVLHGGIELPEGEAASLFLDAPAADTFSVLELRDRVVIMLLFDQIVHEDQVELAWQLWQQMSREGAREPLWRVLTLFPELDCDLIYAEAARVYGFEEARVSRSRALTLMQQMARQFGKGLWDRLVELRVIPVAEAEQNLSLRKRLVFAARDPTNPEVHRLMPQLDIDGFELRYAPESEIINLLIEAFPHRYNHLKNISGVTKDLLAGIPPADPETPRLSVEKYSDALRAEVIDLFEDVLEAAVGQGATDVCLLPTPTGELEVYCQIRGDLQRQRVIEHPAPRDVIAVIKRDVICAEPCGEGRIRRQIIERNVQGHLVPFRVSAVPASEEVHAECIVIRVLS